MTLRCDCFDMERRIWLYVDRELPAEEIAEVSARLAECEHCRQFYLECAREANAYRVAFVDTPFGDAFTASFLRRMENEGLVAPRASAARRNPASVRPLAPEVRRFRWRGLLSLAAMFLFVSAVVSFGFYFTRDYPLPRLGALRSEGHMVSVLRGDRTHAQLVDRGEVRAGDRLIVPDGADLFLLLQPAEGGEASLVRLIGPARLHVDLAARAHFFRAMLERGLLVADVGRDPLRRGFSIETQTSAVDVTGTLFALEAHEAGSRLTVFHGSVNFRSLEGRTSQPVTAETGSWRTDAERPGIFAAATDVVVPDPAGRQAGRPAAASAAADDRGPDPAAVEALGAEPASVPPALPEPPHSDRPAPPVLDRPVSE